MFDQCKYVLGGIIGRILEVFDIFPIPRNANTQHVAAFNTFLILH